MEDVPEVKAEVVAPATTKALSVVPENTGVIHPLATPEEAAQAIKEWEALKATIISEKDVRREKRKAKQPDGSYKEMDVSYLKKSAWRKMSTFFGLRVEVIPETEKMQVINGVKLAGVSYRATAKNGVSCDGDGHCGSDEPGKFNWTLSNLQATAHTRAYNRAVSNLVGGGEVSADEIGGDIAGESEETEKEVSFGDSKEFEAFNKALAEEPSPEALAKTWGLVNDAHKTHKISEKEYQTLAKTKDARKKSLAEAK